MTKEEQLNIFLENVDELLSVKFILSEVKIVAVLKTIATMPVLFSVVKSCLNGFDFSACSKMHLTDNSLEENKGQFVPIVSSRETIAFTFNILMKIDGKEIDFSDFLEKYFYGDGSIYSAYSNFINSLIIPFRSAMIYFVNSLSGDNVGLKVDELDQKEAMLLTEKAEREKTEKEKEEKDAEQKKATVLRIKELLRLNKITVKESKLEESEKDEIFFVIDMLANVIDSKDSDSVKYAFLSYKYCSQYYKKYLGKNRKILLLMAEGVIDGLK